MWEVNRKCYPSWDETVETCEEETDARQLAEDLTRSYRDDGWRGHPWYRSKFYAREAKGERRW